MIRLHFQFFRFVIVFNLFITLWLFVQAIGFVERHGAAVLTLFFWFKVSGSALSYLAESFFNLKSKRIFLRNIGQSPSNMLIRLYLLDLTFYLFLCLLTVVYI